MSAGGGWPVTSHSGLQTERQSSVSFSIAPHTGFLTVPCPATGQSCAAFPILPSDNIGVSVSAPSKLSLASSQCEEQFGGGGFGAVQPFRFGSPL